MNLMFQINLTKSVKFLIVFLVLFAFIFSIVVSWMSVETTYHVQTNTAPCSQGETQTGCSQTFQHIDFLRGLFASTLLEARAALLMQFIIFLLAIFTVFWSRFRKERHDQLVSSRRFFHFKNPELLFCDHLKLAFARGILNPKIY